MHIDIMTISNFLLYVIFLTLMVILMKFALRIIFFTDETQLYEYYAQRRIALHQQVTAAQSQDRQGNIYTVSDDIASNNAVPPRFPDFFYLEPGSEEAARIRAQLEKDDKELPSYDEVLRMTAMTQTAQAATTVAALPAAIPPNMPLALGASNSSFATTATDISLPPAPPYTEIDMNATVPVPAVTSTESALHSRATTTMTTQISTATPAAGIVPSTSRAAAATLEVVTNPATASMPA